MEVTSGDLELDVNEHIFDDENDRKELQRQMARLSPRRAMNDDSFATTTLPFYEDITPSEAVQRLFAWFQKPAEKKTPDASNESAEETMTLAEFNVLRKCLGKAQVTDQKWKRALKELGANDGDDRVMKKDFKALFGPPPFFGSENVQGIVREVMKSEEFIHFAQILVDRFGSESSDSSGLGKVIGLEELQKVQRACCADILYGVDEWKELCQKIKVSESQAYLNWMQFTELFSHSIKNKQVFAPHLDPAAVVYAVLANQNVVATIKDQDEETVSRKAFTNLLRVQRESVDDEVWIQLLQNIQTTYNYRKQHRQRKDSLADGDSGENSDGHGHEQPHVMVRNTRNQVLSYEIMFAEHGEVGLGLQSDFRGHCLTVAEITGQAALHPIIQVHDIVAAVNDVNLIFDTQATSKEEEQQRLARGIALLDGDKVRKIVFHRQESYFQFDPDEGSGLHLCLHIIEQIPPDANIVVELPSGLSWKPPTGAESSLKVQFDIEETYPDFKHATIMWKSDITAVEISLHGETAIAGNSTLVMNILGLDCGSEMVFGPCEVSHGVIRPEGDITKSVCFVTLYDDWNYRSHSLQKNPIRERKRRSDEYFDQSLKPLGKDFHAGDPGIMLESDFFGQCAVVKKVTKLSPADSLDVREHDILSSIISLGDNGENSLNELNCIKPFALNERDAEIHIKNVRKQLAACHKSGRPYRLQFLRLNSYFFHENGRTIFTFHPLTTLRAGTSITIKMPNAKWFINGPLQCHVLEPDGIKIRETFWDSQQHSVHMFLDDCMVAETIPIVLEIQGISCPTKAGSKINNVRCAGPSEIISMHHGEDVISPELEFELHEHWHSFLVGHQGIEVSKISDTLKRFKTSPSLLWEVLEYTSLLFEMCKEKDSEYLTLMDLNKLIRIVCGDDKQMNPLDWNSLCRSLGAKPLIGLSRRQFACCWYDVVGLSSHSAKDVYVRLHTAEKLFTEIGKIFQDEDERDWILCETIDKLENIVGLSPNMKSKALTALREQNLPGWDRDGFTQIVCGGNPLCKFDDNAANLWTKIYYSRKLFDAYSVKKKMKKEKLAELLSAAKITKPKLTNELWSEICESVGRDDTSGLTLADFLEIYAGSMLGSRDSLADYYRIETFKLLPERRGKEFEISKEAVLNVAPEKVNVKDIAAQVLADTASTEELFQDLLAKGLEFSKLEKIEERVSTTFQFTSSFAAKKRSRSNGFLHMQVRGITELADRLIQKHSSFNKGDEAEELYAMFEITDIQGLQDKLPKPKKQRPCSILFGERNVKEDYVVSDQEMWNEQRMDAQMIMRRLHELEQQLKACKPRTPEYETGLASIKALEKQLIPAENKAFDGRIFSSLLLRDPSPDTIVRFPDDKFRLYVDLPEDDSKQLLVVCKLFKRIGSAKSRLELNLRFAQEGLKKAESTYSILQDLVEQQNEHLRYVIAEGHAMGIDTVNDSRVWMAMSKLKQKRQDLADFYVEVQKQRASLTLIEEELNAVTQRETENAGDNNVEIDTDRTTNEVRGSSKESNKLKANDPKKKTSESNRVKFIGQAFFDLAELLRVLHSDNEHTEDLATFTTEHHADVGALLLHFQYKCESLQCENLARTLRSLTISQARNDFSGSTDTKKHDEIALEYPSDTHLELNWESDMLKKGDRICVVREGDQYKLSMPYFLLLWNSVKTELSHPNQSVEANADNFSNNEDTEACDWWVPDILKKMYSATDDQIVKTNLPSSTSSKRSGILHFPSSVDLSLPPGTYKLYLLRNEKDDKGNNFRTVLGQTQSLIVLPGVNSVHTSFGTTPLIDVKSLSASLQVFSEQDRIQAFNAWNIHEDYDEQHEREIELEQELEVIRYDIRAAEAEYEKKRYKKHEKTAEHIAKLKQILESIHERGNNVNVGVDPVTGSTLSKPTIAPRSGIARSHTVISTNDTVVFSYRFRGGSPSPQDRIVILPAEVVRVSDFLRSTILGKLQVNDPRQVEFIRATMERELLEVEQFFNFNMSLTGIFKMIYRWIKPYLICGGTGPKNKSDAYKSITGATDGSFVWEECMKAFNTASRNTKKCFPFIIRELLDEIGSRKAQLGLKSAPRGNKHAMIAKVDMKMMIGLEIPVLANSTVRRSSGVLHNNEKINDVVGESKITLGRRFHNGGLYVAKYIRRSGDLVGTAKVDQLAGELCRYGPFYVKPALFSYSPVQIALFVGRLIVKAATSNRGKLAFKVFGHAVIGVIKYLLAIISLSFNFSVLAESFKISHYDFDILKVNFRDKLAIYLGPFEDFIQMIRSFFNGKWTLNFDVFDITSDCMSGFALWYLLALVLGATFIVYVVVQEDLLLKVQKIHTYLHFQPGKTLQGLLEQFGALLVIPLYLLIKSCVLFISDQWSWIYSKLDPSNPSWSLIMLKLKDLPNDRCSGTESVNFGFGIVALILIIVFLFICLPLLLLDVYSWVPLSELEDKKILEQKAHSFNRNDIKAAIHSNADLVECNIMCCSRRSSRDGMFQRHYNDYMEFPFRDLLKRYGLLKLLGIFIHIYVVLMLKSMGRSLGVLLGWRQRGAYMYRNPLIRPTSRWKFFDYFCIRFNMSWKMQYIRDKIVVPLINVVMVTLGLWGESQWKEFNIEERANDCYIMEPSGEIKQLQMMTLHGKIISLFWLCVPNTMVLAYLAEVLNRGPMFSYFINNQFLQSDTPESEREKNPVWRFHPVFAFSREEDVTYLSETRFFSTFLKWGSSIVEIVSLLSVYQRGISNQTILFGIAIITTMVTPVLEFNQQVIKAYVDYMETVEDLATSSGLATKFESAEKFVDNAQQLEKQAPGVTVNLQALQRRGKRAPPQSSAITAIGDRASATPSQKIQARSSPYETREATSTSIDAHNKTNGRVTITNTDAVKSSTTVGAAIPSSLLAIQNTPMHLGDDQTWDIEGEFNDAVEDAEDEVEEEIENAAINDEIAAAGLAAIGMVRSVKQLILLKAMPQISYVVLTDALDAGEGEITISWQINARQRFHALDAIGMFPARAPGDVSIRTMEDCICYRLLKDKNAEPFGWHPKNRSDEDFERELIIRQAKSLRDISEREVSRIALTSLNVIADGDHDELRSKKHEQLLLKADTTMNDMLHSPKLKPIKKKLSDMLEEEVVENKLHLTAPRTSRMFSKAAAVEEAGKKARKTVSGLVKFRPANNCIREDDPLYENFIYGNNAGIYQSKYGLHGYEFCYLRYVDAEAKVVGLGEQKKAQGGSDSKNPSPVNDRSKYEVLGRFTSNEVQIGTFNIFMSLTCDVPLIGANETLNLSWIIYGVAYSILSHSKIRNCIGFYKVEGSNDAECSKIEIVPSSAYLQVDDNEPCPGRMSVTAPSEPGIYEIRFLFNFFKKGQLHRQCQVFGHLEDQMQELRIRSFYEQRAVTEEIRKFSLKEPTKWGIARMNTFVWLKSMLLSTLREPVEGSIMESTTEYGEFLYGRLKKKLQRGLECPSRIYQKRITQMLAPLHLNAFMEVLIVALASNTQINDQLASIAFMSPTDEDVRNMGLNKQRDSLLLPTDRQLLVFGNVSFYPLARNYLNQPSLCGYHDFLDDIILTHSQLLLIVDQVMDKLSSSCITLYESAIMRAVKAMMKEAEAQNLTNVLQGIDILLADLCRNHVQSSIRAFMETDCRTGMRWKGPVKGTIEKLNALRSGIIPPEASEIFKHVPEGPGVLGPVTRQHIAVRRWIRPKLEKKISTILQQRYARLLSGNIPIITQMLASCLRPGLSLAGNPFPNHREMRTRSPLYFLQESQDSTAVSNEAKNNADRQAADIDNRDEENMGEDEDMDTAAVEEENQEDNAEEDNEEEEKEEEQEDDNFEEEVDEDA